MSAATIEIKVPDIGDFKNIPVIEINVAVGGIVAAEQTLLTLESDKATLDVPAPVAGRIAAIKVAVGDKVSEGSLVVVMEVLDASAQPAEMASEPDVTASDHAELLVIGAGPGGYTAAFRAADLGKKVVLVDRRASLGGVCLNVGCIPSKALLHAAKTIKDAAAMAGHGVNFGPPAIDLDNLRDWKRSVVGRLTAGLVDLARRRNVSLVNGDARFNSANTVVVSGPAGPKTISFDQAIIAAGSEPVSLPFIPHGDPRVIDSTGALELQSIPGRLLVIGGGIIGLEMGTVYEALGSRVTVVELQPQLIPGADKDLVAPLHKRLTGQFESILLQTKITEVEDRPDGLLAKFEGLEADDFRLTDTLHWPGSFCTPAA